MRLRRWISVLAVLGVLLHAGALVRHNAGMLGALLDYQALASSLGEICHGGATSSDAAALPSIPKPSEAQNGCPLCSGLGSAFALTGPEPVPVALPLPVALILAAQTAAVPSRPHAIHPPARGPPARA